MASHEHRGQQLKKRLRATARFLATYGRLPTEFDPETAMGLAANIPAIEAAEALTLAQGIRLALGEDPSAHARAVFAATGSAALAQRIEVQGKMRKAMNG